MLLEQDGKCAICKSTDNLGRYMCVDHNHETGELRGLLCTNCNQALGLFKENLNNLENALSYFRKYIK